VRIAGTRVGWLVTAAGLAVVLLFGTGAIRLRLARRAPEPPAARHYRAGLELARAGDERRAVSEWNLAIAMNPSDPRPYGALVEYWEANGRPDQAAQTMERLTNANPTAPHRDCRFARAAFAAGWVTRSTEAAARAIREEPACPLARTMQGILLADAGEPAAALTELIRARHLDPDDERIALTLAQLEGRSGHRPAALERVRAVLGRNPASPQAHYLMGWLQARASPRTLATDAEAVRHLRLVLADDPEHAGARTEMGALLLRQGQLAQARPLLDAAARQNPGDAGLARSRALLYGRLNDPRAAALAAAADRLETQQRRRVELRRCHRREPSNAAVTVDLARLELASGQTREAHDLIRRLLAANPSDREALALLHRILGTPEPPPP
jgi:tetratricopeptide (TPR) repeat protein